MKAAESKTTTTAQHLQSKGGEQHPFFQIQEERPGAFWGNEPPATKPFFTPFIQTKLPTGQPGDKYEQEADAMADEVVQRLAVGNERLAVSSEQEEGGGRVQKKCAACEAGSAFAKASADKEENIQMKAIFESNEEPAQQKVQRKCAACEAKDIQPSRIQRMGAEEEEPGLQAKSEIPDMQASPDLESRLNASRGGGSPLHDETRTSMESAFGTDFSGVRVHTNSGAVQMNQELGAQAFTHGNNIYFNSGKYNPGNTEGQRLLGHELTHVVQQGDNTIRRQCNSEYESCIEHSSNRPVVNPQIASLPANLYIDLFHNAIYDIDYRAEGGNLSKILSLNYQDGTILDINIDDIIDESMEPSVAITSMANGHLGRGGRIFPQDLNGRTVPRLFAAKRAAIEAMEEYNVQFMMMSVAALITVITAVAGATLGGGPVSASRRQIPRRNFIRRGPRLSPRQLGERIRQMLRGMREGRRGKIASEVTEAGLSQSEAALATETASMEFGSASQLALQDGNIAIIGGRIGASNPIFIVRPDGSVLRAIAEIATDGRGGLRVVTYVFE